MPSLPLRGLSLSVANPKPLFLPLTSQAVFVCFVQTLISWHSEMFSAHRAHFPLRHGARHFFKELCFYLLRDSSDISFWERSVLAVTFPFCSLPTKLLPAHLSGSRWRKIQALLWLLSEGSEPILFFSLCLKLPTVRTSLLCVLYLLYVLHYSFKFLARCLFHTCMGKGLNYWLIVFLMLYA